MKSNKAKTKRESIYIVPTRYGFLYGLIVFFFLFAGTFYENSSVLFAASMLVTFGLICMHQTHSNIAKVNIDNLELESGFAHQTVNWKLRMKNGAPLTSFSVNIRDVVIDVPPGDTFIENIPVMLRRRGLVRMTELKISSTYPFGLFYTWKWWKGDKTFYVYPALLNQFQIPSVNKVNASDLEAHEDFMGHREYVPGDSAHHVDWKVHARRQKMMVKIFDTHNPEAVMLDWNSAPGNDAEEKLSYLATAARECFRLQKAFGLVMPDETFPLSVSRAHYKQVLRKLALYEAA